VTVRVPPRPPGPGDLHDRSALERLREQQALIEEARLREQQALIEEARRRTRRRRQRYAALALGGVAVVVVLGFTGVSGGHPRDMSDASAPSGQGTAAARNGKIARADDLGRLQVVAPDASGLQVVAQCQASPQEHRQRTLPALCL
jgi:hypothetical protein